MGEPFLDEEQFPRLSKSYQKAMNPKDPQAELRKKIQDFAVRYYEAIADDDYELAEKLTIEQLALFQAHQQELLSELLGELPEKSNAPASDSSYTSGEIIGWNDAIDQVVSVIKSKIGELNG